MNEIRPGLFIGTMEEATDLEFLRLNKITAVLNVAHGVNDPVIARGEDIANVKIGLGDTSHNKPYLKELAVYALKMMLAADERILVHCRLGISRAVWVVCRTLADFENRDPNEVFGEVMDKRTGARHGPLFDERASLQPHPLDRTSY